MEESPKKNNFLNLLTNPIIDPQDLQEQLFLGKSELMSFISEKENQEELTSRAEMNIMGFWGSVLRAVLQKSLEGDVQALKLLFEYVEKKGLFEKEQEINLHDTTFEQRKILAKQIRKRIAELKKKDKEKT